MRVRVGRLRIPRLLALFLGAYGLLFVGLNLIIDLHVNPIAGSIVLACLVFAMFFYGPMKRRHELRQQRRDDKEGMGVVSPAFARLMIIQLPVGILFILVGATQQFPDAIAGTIVTAVGIFVTAYSLIVWLVIMVLLRKRSKQIADT